MRYLVTTLLIAINIGIAYAQNVSTDPTMTTGFIRAIDINTGKFVGKGHCVAVSTKTLMTNAHIAERKGIRLMVEIQGRLVEVEPTPDQLPDRDLALLRVKEPNIRLDYALIKKERIDPGELLFHYRFDPTTIYAPIQGSTFTLSRRPVIHKLEKFRSFTEKEVLQTGLLLLDSTIIPGHSGSGIFDQHGALCGIVAAGLVDDHKQLTGFVRAVPLPFPLYQDTK